MKPSCMYCKQSQLNFLADGRYECSFCKLRYSPKKKEKIKTLIESFCKGLSPKEAALKQNLSLPTAQNYYLRFRNLLPSFLERVYREDEESYIEYEEYLFLPKYKRAKLDYIAEGIGIMGLHGNGKVYTLLMPDYWKNQSSDEPLSSKATLAHYYQWHKIMKLDSFENPLSSFWKFLEIFMKSFHGVKRDYFGLYLKEAEFKFNFKQEKQVLHMEHLWEEHMKKLRSRNRCLN